jgi:hypothetical protein
MNSPLEILRTALLSLQTQFVYNWVSVFWAFIIGLAITGTIFGVRRTLWVHGWNTQSSNHAGIAAFCLFTSIVSVCAVVLTMSFWSAPKAFDTAFKATRDEVLADETRGIDDGGWRRATFVRIGEEVRERGLEDFKNRTTPKDGATDIPVTKMETARMIAGRYVEEVDANLGAGGFGLIFPQWQAAFSAPLPPISLGTLSLPASGTVNSDYIQTPFIRTAVESRVGQWAASLNPQVISVAKTSAILLWGPAVLLELLAFLITARAAVREMRFDF